MPKRKRGNFEDDDDRLPSASKKDVLEKLIQSKKLLHRALKIAKGFQRQRLGKRLKAATGAGSTDALTRINREIEVLRSLDLDKMTEMQLYRSLMKVKAISTSELLPVEVSRELSRPEGTEENRKALHNVMSGMWKMKPVKDVMEKVMNGMYIALGIPAPVRRPTGQAQKESIEGTLEVGIVNVPRRAKTEGSEALVKTEESGFEEPSWDGFNSADESEDLVANGGVEIDGQGTNEELDEALLSHYDALLGGLSEEESFDGSNYDLRRYSQSSRRLSISLSPHSSQSEAESQSTPPRLQRAPNATKTKTETPKAPPANAGGSTFLPTLMGGYWSGSESSASDLEESTPQNRKNRPGQMARRAIWEKKFGERANHIKQGQGAVAQNRPKGRDDGWDAKRGAKESDRDRRRGKGKRRDFRQATGENALAVEPRKRANPKRDDVGVLHPSWQAAKKAKEAKTSAAFQGRKITFE